MTSVEPEVFLLATSYTRNGSMHNWLEHLGVKEETVDRIIKSGKTDAEKIVESAGRRCYKSFEPGLNPNVTKIREDIALYLENILKSGHGSVLEHVTFTFAIENVSRVFTGEMNRHRAGMAISEGSMRYIRYDDIPFWMPTSLQDQPDDSPEIRAKKETSRKVICEVLNQIEIGYLGLCEIWKDELKPESKFHAKKQITSMMRRIIPMGVATGGIWTGNIRALRHICQMRCTPHAEEEIFLVVGKMLEILKNKEPNFFGDFEIDEKGNATPKYSKV